MTRWEYNICCLDTTEDANELGREGWELVSAFLRERPGEYEMRPYLSCVFKRPITESAAL